MDHTATLFQNLNGNTDHVDFRFDGADTKVLNTRFNTNPIVIHGNGPSKIHLNYLANYISNSWSFATSCISCKENTYRLKYMKV